jgi:hypothetical protein
LVGGGGGSHGKHHANGTSSGFISTNPETLNMVARTILESCKRVQRKVKMAVC